MGAKKVMENNSKELYIKVLEDFIQKLRSDEVTDFEIESSNPPQMMFSPEHRDFIRVPSENHSIDIRYTLKKKEVKGLFKCPECKSNLDDQMFCAKCCCKWTKSWPGKEESIDMSSNEYKKCVNELFNDFFKENDQNIEEAEIEWSDIDSITNIPKTSKQLADEHWEYIEALLKAHEEEYNIKQIEFHYKSAFIHGYKHAIEEK